jgi:predicted dehydrogenase
MSRDVSHIPARNCGEWLLRFAAERLNFHPLSSIFHPRPAKLPSMRLAFIGGHGHHYLRGALTDPQIEIDDPIAVAGDGHDDAAAEELARSLPNARWFADPVEMLDRFMPHAVSVGCVYGYTSDLAAMVLQRDIPVVSDKPIASTWQQFARMQEITANTQRVIATEFDMRCRPEFAAAKEAVAAGLVGDVVLAVAQKSYRFRTRPTWYGDRKSYPGTLMWIASHGIDAIPFVTGRRYRKVTSVQGNISRTDYPDFQDHCIAMFQLDNGGSAVVHADFLRPNKADSHGDDRLRVIGSKGLIEIRANKCLLTTNDREETDITQSGITRPLHVELLAALERQSEKYGTASSMELAEILLKARDSVEKGTFVDL